MIEDFISALKAFSENNSIIESVILVGSYARGTNQEDSDLDIVVITPNKAEMVANQDFVQNFGKVLSKQTEYYGACTSVRVWYENGPEVEFGIAEPSWIERPLDRETYKVLSDGYQIILDKKHYFENLTPEPSPSCR